MKKLTDLSMDLFTLADDDEPYYDEDDQTLSIQWAIYMPIHEIFENVPPCEIEVSDEDYDGKLSDNFQWYSKYDPIEDKIIDNEVYYYDYDTGESVDVEFNFSDEELQFLKDCAEKEIGMPLKDYYEQIKADIEYDD